MKPIKSVPKKRSRVKLSIKEYKDLIVSIFKRDSWKCRFCKVKTNLHAHHIKYRSQGGDDSIDNLITLCENCHKAIHNRYIVILPVKDSDKIDANKKVKFLIIEKESLK